MRIHSFNSLVSCLVRKRGDAEHLHLHISGPEKHNSTFKRKEKNQIDYKEKFANCSFSKEPLK